MSRSIHSLSEITNLLGYATDLSATPPKRFPLACMCPDGR